MMTTDNKSNSSKKFVTRRHAYRGLAAAGLVTPFLLMGGYMLSNPNGTPAPEDLLQTDESSFMRFEQSLDELKGNVRGLQEQNTRLSETFGHLNISIADINYLNEQLALHPWGVPPLDASSSSDAGRPESMGFDIN